MPDYTGITIGIIKEIIGVATNFIPQPKLDEKTILTDLETAEVNSERVKLIRVLMDEVKDGVKCPSCQAHIAKAEEEIRYLEKEVPRIERVNALRANLKNLLEEAKKEMKPEQDIESLQPLLEEKPVHSAPQHSTVQRSDVPGSVADLKQQIKSACVPCAIGHFTTSSKLLSEAVRFKKDGLESPQVMSDIAEAIAEQNALERIDLTPAKIQNLPEWEKAMAADALERSRDLRHRLETVGSMDQLEKIAADTENFYKDLHRNWFSQRIKKKEEVKTLSSETVKVIGG